MTKNVHEKSYISLIINFDVRQLIICQYTASGQNRLKECMNVYALALSAVTLHNAICLC